MKNLFGRLTFLELGEPYLTKSGGRIERWVCQCSCGNRVLVRKYPVIDGRTKSCGCLRRETTSFHRRFSDPKQAQINATLRSYRKNAKDRGIIWKLTNDQAIALFLAPCFYCGDLQSNECKVPKNVKFGEPFRYNGIDRLDNSVEYNIVNCVSCCKIHNSMKGAMEKDVFIQECQKVVQFNREKSYVVTSK